MREIKFRGLRTDGKGWIYGSLSMVDSRSQRIGKNYGQMFICQVQTMWQNTDKGKMIGNWIEVHPESVGQFTGLTDKNEVEIYEGDVMDYGHNRTFYVSYVGMQFVASFNKSVFNSSITIYVFNVIGNIHENKELLS